MSACYREDTFGLDKLLHHVVSAMWATYPGVIGSVGQGGKAFNLYATDMDLLFR